MQTICRPFDDISQERIADEILAINRIFIYTNSSIFEAIISDVVLAELSLVQNSVKRELIELFVSNFPLKRAVIGDNEIKIADFLYRTCNIKDYMDILHIAAALKSNCKYLLACDDELTDKTAHIKEKLLSIGFTIEIINPVGFWKEV